MQLKLQGKITAWNDEKGFGFITPVSGGDRIFVHIKAFQKRHRRPQVNQQISYTLSTDKQGRACAADVTCVGKGHVDPKRLMQQSAAVVAMALFFAALGVLTLAIPIIPKYIIGWYAIASAITFMAYAADKSAAQNGQWRISEATLHTLALAGGWPGALLAQQMLRHKSRKPGFQWTYKFTVVLNIVVTAWLLTPRGSKLTMEWLHEAFK
ncbi:Cold shock-like protein CspG [Pontiella desulfatans]|uniref:Cold shock-like protein CspG n=1 Tax=Pontiella desulfatans TaxID=2750659 RepID=A0A6C2UB51_PONDE|nr:cold shock and DUF1294 domain-containing protein [Pontiella desulfatans]VGO16867.1 Cold shock-like protein CspG [Pontiella desulfatans]